MWEGMAMIALYANVLASKLRAFLRDGICQSAPHGATCCSSIVAHSWSKIEKTGLDWEIAGFTSALVV